jgi:RHS repeat-associated protein
LVRQNTRPSGHSRWINEDTIKDKTNYLYTGQELDPEIGLYNYKARLYDAELGRFISPDSVIPNVYDAQEINPYSYVTNNPLKYTDPSGHVQCGRCGFNHGSDMTCAQYAAQAAAAVPAQPQNSTDECTPLLFDSRDARARFRQETPRKQTEELQDNWQEVEGWTEEEEFKAFGFVEVQANGTGCCNQQGVINYEGAPLKLKLLLRFSQNARNALVEKVLFTFCLRNFDGVEISFREERGQWLIHVADGKTEQQYDGNLKREGGKWYIYQKKDK